MGYLDKTTLTVEAVLTKKGRELLAKNGELKITKFALSDDEVDYDLWNEAHPLGSSHYGSAIENMPLLEASVDETQVMRYKLVTLPKSTTRMPILDLGFSLINLKTIGQRVTIEPETKFFTDDRLGYTAILHNSDYAFLEVKDAVDQTVAPVVPTFLREEDKSQSIIKVGRSFNIISKDISAFISSNVNTPQSVETTLTVIGNNTGAVSDVTVRVTQS